MQTKTKETKPKAKQKRWLYFRHRVVRNILAVTLGTYTKWKYGVKADRFREQGDRAYLILMNHQTAFDQFFVGVSFKGPVYYLASEDLFSNGWVSSVIRYLVAPIPIKKQTTDIHAVMNCIRVAKEGGTIAIAPEGNRTYSGKTQYMSPAIAGLARKLNLPIALYRIEGGYGVQPRWSDGTRRGKMHAYVSRVIEPEEYLERAMYVCPFCGLSEFESHGNEITCKKCGRVITYGEDKTLKGEGFAFPFRFVNDWYDYQNDFINALDVLQYTQEPMYTDAANLSQVIVYEKKQLLRKNAQITLYGDRIVIDEGSAEELQLPFLDVNAVTVLGRNKLNIYWGKQLYQLKSGKRFNALKYVHIYHRHKNIIRGNENGEFLGI